MGAERRWVENEIHLGPTISSNPKEHTVSRFLNWYQIGPLENAGLSYGSYSPEETELMQMLQAESPRYSHSNVSATRRTCHEGSDGPIAGYPFKTEIRSELGSNPLALMLGNEFRTI